VYPVCIAELVLQQPSVCLSVVARTDMFYWLQKPSQGVWGTSTEVRRQCFYIWMYHLHSEGFHSPCWDAMCLTWA
jgi:hypothetical protein